MPLTALQNDVLAVLAAHRSEASHFAGGVVLNAAADSARYSHDFEFDLATNKALTLSARTETRDYVDILELHRRFPLAAIRWAACGKDPGFTPLSLRGCWPTVRGMDGQ